MHCFKNCKITSRLVSLENEKSHGEFIYSLTIIGHQEPELRQQNSIPLHGTKQG